MDETRLRGGRITEGVVRVGDTVRRPTKTNSPFVRDLLSYLEAQGFDGAPRYLGVDDQGRETFSYLEGEVPSELEPELSDQALIDAARLIRRFHDATAGSALAGEQETVCHHDLSPCNFVFRHGRPIGIIDFDAAAPGSRLEDLGYAIFLWLNLGTDGPPPNEQARRIGLLCAAYASGPDRRVIAAVVHAVVDNIERLKRHGRQGDVEWWSAQLDWLQRHRGELDSAIDRTRRPSDS
jgi:aminoglycoside phosphotransferase (APT) family kinase protein